jgi:hypothetical protein
MIPAEVAQHLAYYKSEYGQIGALAPRGWHCFGTYGSSGTALYISPEPINGAEFFSAKSKDFGGPVIEMSMEYGGTSGRFGVARTIARVFPAHFSFARSVISEGLEPASDFPRGPFPKDRLTYRSNEIVEFQTPPYEKGLGTNSRLRADGTPIRGVAILHGQDTDLLQLSVRLPQESSKLTQIIIEQTERDAMRLRD